MSRDRPQSLAQLQAEWRATAETIAGTASAAGVLACADALQPHVEREAAAQAKSLADERRIASLEAELIAERTRRLKAEEALSWYYAHCGGDPSDPAFKYFAQYPRVGEDK